MTVCCRKTNIINLEYQDSLGLFRKQIQGKWAEPDGFYLDIRVQYHGKDQASSILLQSNVFFFFSKKNLA
jgi:hypothetical protein